MEIKQSIRTLGNPLKMFNVLLTHLPGRTSSFLQLEERSEPGKLQNGSNVRWHRDAVIFLQSGENETVNTRR
jgi:hypothetical protein